MILTVGYTGSRGEHLLLTREYNAPQLINGAFGTRLAQRQYRSEHPAESQPGRSTSAIRWAIRITTR